MMVAVALSSIGAVVTLRPPETSEGLIAVPIHIAPGDGDQMASLQFDLDFDAASVYVTSVEAGACASEAAKDVVFSRTAEGTVRVIVAGMNQNTLEEGVVATVYMQRVDDGSTTPVMELDSIVVADPVGNSVESAYENLTVEEPADAESGTSNSTSDDASEASLTSQPEATSADKSLDNSVFRTQGNWPSGNGTENQLEHGQVVEDSVLNGASKVIPGEESSRIHVNVAGDRVEHIAPLSSTSEQRQSLSRHVSTTRISGADNVAAPNEAAVASGGATGHAISTPKNTLVALAPQGTLAPGVVRHEAAVKPMGTLSSSHTYGSWSWLWFLVPVAVILAIMAARRVFIGRLRKSRVVRIR